MAHRPTRDGKRSRRRGLMNVHLVQSVRMSEETLSGNTRLDTCGGGAAEAAAPEGEEVYEKLW